MNPGYSHHLLLDPVFKLGLFVSTFFVNGFVALVDLFFFSGTRPAGFAGGDDEILIREVG